MTEREALKLALEALEKSHTCPLLPDDCAEAITAIEEALAQPEQEPVAWMYEVNNAHTCLDLFEPPDDAYDEGTLHPLYTTPPQRKPLTDEEIAETLTGYRLSDAIDITRAIEAAHGIKEKNT